MQLLVVVMVILGALFNRAVDKYDYVLDSWAGETETRLVEVWGEPQERLEPDDIDDDSVYIYSKTGKSLTGKTKLCVSRFMIDKSKTVVGSNYYGDACRGFYGDNRLPG